MAVSIPRSVIRKVRVRDLHPTPDHFRRRRLVLQLIQLCDHITHLQRQARQAARVGAITKDEANEIEAQLDQMWHHLEWARPSLLPLPERAA